MNERLKAFCDGVFAIAITLLVLDIKVPGVGDIHSSGELARVLRHNWPTWFAFFLSFTAMFIAWINHSRTLKQLHKSSGAFLYANGLLMLTVTVYPFTTSFLAQYLNTPFAQIPVFVYCLMNTIHATAWVALHHFAIYPVNLTSNEKEFNAIRSSRNVISYTVLFNAGMCVLAFWLPTLAVALTALAWIVYLIMGMLLVPIDDDY